MQTIPLDTNKKTTSVHLTLDKSLDWLRNKILAHLTENTPYKNSPKSNKHIARIYQGKDSNKLKYVSNDPSSTFLLFQRVKTTPPHLPVNLSVFVPQLKTFFADCGTVFLKLIVCLSSTPKPSPSPVSWLLSTRVFWTRQGLRIWLLVANNGTSVHEISHRCGVVIFA